MATANLPRGAGGPRKQTGKANQPKILRIGVIQAGKIVEERLVRRRESVTIGASPRNTIVVPASTLPKSFTLFELQSGGQYQLVFSDTMDGRVSVDNKVMALDQVKQQGRAQQKGKLYRLGLNDASRGKVLLGEITLLFQFVAPPPVQPRPQLPPSVRGSLVGQMDWPLTSSFAANAAIIGAFLVYLNAVDFPRKLAPDVIPDDFARYTPTVEKPKPKVLDMKKLEKVGEKKVEKVAKKQGGGKHKRRGKHRKSKPCDADCQAKRAAARRARLAAQVAKMGALKILGAKGAGGSARDLLKSGDPGASADKAFKGVGGLSVSRGGGKGGLRGKGGGGSGKAVGIGDLGGRVGGPGKVGIKGKVVEKVPKGIVKKGGKIERDSTLKGSAVARVIRRGMRAVQACYQRALKRNPKLGGKVGIRLTISPVGKVTMVEIETNSVDPQVGSCIKRVAKRWRFPPPEGGGVAEVAVPFVFTASH